MSGTPEQEQCAAVARAKEDLSKAVTEAYRFEYQDRSAWWRDLDQKAQGTVAIAGVLLAGAFAFVQQLETAKGLLEIILLALSVLLLLGAVALAVRALLIREVDLPPAAEAIEELAREVLASTDSQEIPERAVGLAYDQAKLWRDANQSIYNECRAKARSVALAQIAILAAAFLIAVITIARILEPAIVPREGRRDEVQQTRVREFRRLAGQPVLGTPTVSAQSPASDAEGGSKEERRQEESR